MRKLHLSYLQKQLLSIMFESHDLHQQLSRKVNYAGHLSTITPTEKQKLNLIDFLINKSHKIHNSLRSTTFILKSFQNVIA
jgi:hypothetical protein